MSVCVCVYVCVCVCMRLYCYACPDFLRFEIGVLCVSSTYLNVLRGEVNPQCFKMLWKRREQYSLDQIFEFL